MLRPQPSGITLDEDRLPKSPKTATDPSMFTANDAKDAKNWESTAEGAEIAEVCKGVLVPISRCLDVPIRVTSVFIRGEVLAFPFRRFWQSWQQNRRHYSCDSLQGFLSPADPRAYPVLKGEHFRCDGSNCSFHAQIF